MLLASFGNGTSFLSETALYCTLVALPCAGATVMNTPSAHGPFLSERLRWLSLASSEVCGATYFCQPSVASALSTVSAVCGSGLVVVKIVLAGLAKTSLAPATRGSRLVSSVPSDFSDLEHPAASSRTQRHETNNERGPVGWPSEPPACPKFRPLHDRSRFYFWFYPDARRCREQSPQQYNCNHCREPPWPMLSHWSRQVASRFTKLFIGRGH